MILIVFILLCSAFIAGLNFDKMINHFFPPVKNPIKYLHVKYEVIDNNTFCGGVDKVDREFAERMVRDEPHRCWIE